MTAAVGTWRLSGRIARVRPGLFTVSTLGWTLFFASPVLLGLILREVFDAVAAGDTGRAYRFIGLFVLVEVVRRVIVHASAIVWMRTWVLMESLPQANMLDAQVASGGPRAAPPVEGPGAAITRFRDDPRDTAMFLDAWLDVGGGCVFGAIAIGVMMSIDVQMSVLVLLPMALVAVTTRVLGARIQAAHRADLEATSSVTGILRDVFHGVTVLRLHDARDAAVAEVARRCAERRHTAVRDRILTEGISAAALSSVDLAIGLVLVVAAGSLGSSEFTVGDLSLFIVYVGYLAMLPRMVGHLLTRRRQAAVSLDRMSELTGGRVEDVVALRPLPIDRPDPVPPVPPPVPRVPLDRLDARGLTHRLGPAAGIFDVDLTLHRGQLTVVRGAIGSGKTTLLRAVLGLVPATGTLAWNGVELDDPAAFMVPPQAAYVPQVPRLFSETVRENVLLGHPADDAAVWKALSAAAMAGDIEAMPDGLDTLIGPRGVRLSGGQRQRLAAARAIVRSPELLVVDDLSSALDTETEVLLWDSVRARGTTVLAVSNRPLAIQRADQVIELVGGRL
jgi:ATP-binding cassette subfamily B protein